MRMLTLDQVNKMICTNLPKRINHLITWQISLIIIAQNMKFLTKKVQNQKSNLQELQFQAAKNKGE